MCSALYPCSSDNSYSYKFKKNKYDGKSLKEQKLLVLAIGEVVSEELMITCECERINRKYNPRTILLENANETENKLRKKI